MKRRSLRGFPFTRHYFSRQLMPNANGQRIIISYLVPRGLNSPRRGRAARSKFDCRNKRGHLKFMGRVFLHTAPGNMLITRLLLMRERELCSCSCPSPSRKRERANEIITNLCAIINLILSAVQKRVTELPRG
jgi:hypothetical protein